MCVPPLPSYMCYRTRGGSDVTDIFLFFLLRQDLFMQFWLFWNSLCWPGWSQNHSGSPVSASQVLGYKGMCHHTWLSYFLSQEELCGIQIVSVSSIPYWHREGKGVLEKPKQWLQFIFVLYYRPHCDPDSCQNPDPSMVAFEDRDLEIRREGRPHHGVSPLIRAWGYREIMTRQENTHPHKDLYYPDGIILNF